jgi:hypothetical protein
VCGAVDDTLLKEQDTTSAQLGNADRSVEVSGKNGSWLGQARSRVAPRADRKARERYYSRVTIGPFVKHNVLMRADRHDRDAFPKVWAPTHRAWMLQYGHMIVIPRRVACDRQATKDVPLKQRSKGIDVIAKS